MTFCIVEALMDLGDSFFLHLEREALCGEPRLLTYLIDQETWHQEQRLEWEIPVAKLAGRTWSHSTHNCWDKEGTVNY